MSTSFFSACIYFIGFVGLASVGLLPFRSWKILRVIFKNGYMGSLKKALAVFVVLMAVAVLWVDVQTVARIFRCLTERYCGPGVASGWVYLAILGAVYLAFEAVLFLIMRLVYLRKIQ